eukprot:TRINITY_DN6601_c0_g1_i2.p1 TRINITY_DN6601_c0_g1~~TRINITY_DN6601_c0_g1_i2.p1  ORF type:complete len:1207 (+),score=478.36 TRINITY_DN6601_c0_g1_i2:86-3706(+)
MDYRSVSPTRLESVRRSPRRELGDMRNMSVNMSNEASRMLMELEANRAASEQARRIQSPRAGMAATPTTPSYTMARTASPKVGTSASNIHEAVLKNELAKQIERTADVEKDRLKSENDTRVKLAIKDDLLTKLNDELHALVEKDAAREEAFMKMDVDLRNLRDAYATTTEKLALTEAELHIKSTQSRGSDEELHETRMCLTKANQELERQQKVKEKLDEMLSISQRSLSEAQSQIAAKDGVIRELEDTLRDVDSKNIEIMKALEDKSRTDAVRMEEMARRNDHLQQVVEDLRKELSRLAQEKQSTDEDYVSQLDRMSYSENTMNERLATSQKTIDCIEAQLAAVKAEQLAAAQDAAVRQQELQEEIARLRLLAEEKQEEGSMQGDDRARIRILEDKLDDMILQDSTSQDKYHNLQAEVERIRGDVDKYRDAHKRVLHQLEQERVVHRKALDDAAAKVREAERKVQEAEDGLHAVKADKQRLHDELTSLDTDMKILQNQKENEKKRLDDMLTSSQDRMNATKATISDFERKADTAMAEAENLRNQKNDLADSNERSTTIITKLKHQLEQLRTQFQTEKNSLQDTLDKKNSDYEDAQNSRMRYESQINRLQGEVDMLRGELQKKEDARLRLAEQLEKERDAARLSSDNALKQSRETNVKLQDEIDALHRALNETKRTIRDMQEQLADLKSEKDRMSASYEDEMEQLRQANAEKVSELKRQLQRAEAKVQAVELAHQRSQDQLKDAEDELDRERQRYRQLQDQIDDERNNNRKTASDRVTELRQQIQELQDQVSGKDMDLVEALRRADQLQLDLERAEKALRNKQADMDNMDAQHKRDRDNWASQLASIEQAMQRAQQEINDLKMQLDDALRDVEKQKSLLRSALNDAEQSDLEKQRRLQQTKERLNASEETVSQLQLQILQLKGQLEDGQIEVTDALKQVQMKDAELKRAEERLKKYQNAGDQIAELQDANTLLEDEVKRLKREVESLRQELGEMQKRLENAKDRHAEDAATIEDLRRQNGEMQEKGTALRESHDGEMRKKNQELFAVQQELTDALNKLSSLGRKALEAEETAEWKNKAECLQKELEGVRAPLTAKIVELQSELEKMAQDQPDMDEMESLRKELREMREKLRSLLEQKTADKLRISELEARIADLEALNKELEEKGKDLEDRGKELSFLLGTRAQLVAQIMSLREAYVSSPYLFPPTG